MLRTLRQAILATRDTPGRSGRLIRLPADAEDVLVAGDIHGNVANFQTLLQTADLAHHPRRHFVLQELIHGPFRYPTGGDKSHQLVDLCAALKCQYGPRVHYLVGNHELSQWTNRVITKADLDLNKLFIEGLESAYAQASAEIYQTYCQLFAACPLAIRAPNRVFVCHTLPSAMRQAQFLAGQLEQEEYADADLKPGGYAHAMLWGRDTSPDNVSEFLRKVDADLLVTGHIACEEGFAVPNDRQIIIDSLASPATYCLFPADRPLTHADLVGCVRFI
jgi:hypothetical protein